MFNLSGVPLEKAELDVLMNGLKFVPTPRKVDNLELRADLLTLVYKLKWQFSFSNRDTTDPDADLVRLKTHSKAPPKPRDGRQLLLCNQIEKISPKTKSTHNYNLSPHLYKAGLRSIIDKLQDLVIKEADKGSGIVIMTKSFYNGKILSMFSDDNYEVSDIDCSTLVKRTRNFINKHKVQLTKKELEAILKQEAFLASFYGLPKIHKSQQINEAVCAQRSELITCLEPNDLKFRPIVSCQSCPTATLSDLLDKLLRPFVKKVKFRLKDTWDFLRKLPPRAQEGDFTMTADISSLYTNITTANGETAILYYHEQFPELLPARFSKNFLIEMYKFCQNNLYFCFQDTTYRQKNGTGMGRSYAPSLADLKQGYDEILLEIKIREVFAPQMAAFFFENYGRFLDDIHFRWKLQWLSELQTIKNVMNTIDENINYEFENSNDDGENSISFLDVKITIKNEMTITDIFNKKTDTFNYVPFNSCHPRHTLRNIPFSLARRIRGIVSDPALVLVRMEDMKRRLRAKKYPLGLIDEGIRLALSMSRDNILHPPTKPIESRAGRESFFVSTYNPRIEDPILDIRQAVDVYNSSTAENYKIKVRSSFRKSPSLKDLLTFQRTKGIGVRGCKDGCILCKEYLHTGESLNLKQGKTLSANEQFDCMSRNLLYAAKCKGCEEFYAGETGDQLSTRFNVHRQQGKFDSQIQAVKADQHFRICGKDKYSVFPFKRLKKNCTIYRRVVEEDFIKEYKPVLNGDSPFQPTTF